MSWSVILFLAGIVIACGLAITWLHRQSSMKILLAREALDDDKLYSMFYSSSGLEKSNVLRAWHDVASALHVPADRLRPSDRFGKEVGRYWITSDELDALAAHAQELSVERGLTVDLEKISTVDEFVRQFARAQLMVPASK